MRQSGRALRKLIRSAAAAGFWSGAAKDEKHDLTSKPLLQAARQGYWDRLLMGPAVEPSRRNGLRKPSQLMVDKLFTVPTEAVGEVVGQLEPQVLVDLDLALRGWLELP